MPFLDWNHRQVEMRGYVFKCWSPAQTAIAAVSSGQLLLITLKAKPQLART